MSAGSSGDGSTRLAVPSTTEAAAHVRQRAVQRNDVGALPGSTPAGNVCSNNARVARDVIATRVSAVGPTRTIQLPARGDGVKEGPGRPAPLCTSHADPTLAISTSNVTNPRVTIRT